MDDPSEAVTYKQIDISGLKIKESSIRQYEKQLVSSAIKDELYFFHEKNNFGGTSIPYEATWEDPPDPITITIDVLSLITSPFGGDAIFDPIGAIYAYNTDRPIDVAIYSATSIGPFVSGGGTKLAKEVLKELPQLIKRSSRQQVARELFQGMFKAGEDDISRLFLKENKGLADDLLSNPELISRLEVLDAPTAKRVLADLIDSKDGRALAKAFKKEPGLVNAWKVLDDAGETALRKDITELDLVAKNLDEIESVGYKTWKTNLAGKFTAKQIDDYVAFATKQNDKTKVMLGMWDGGGSSSYITKAGNDYTYFDFGNKWDEAYDLVNKSDDEIWRINKKFIDNQKAAGKEFWFSHDPFSPKNEQFFAREVNYLIDELDVKDFQKVGDLWKAIW